MSDRDPSSEPLDEFALIASVKRRVQEAPGVLLGIGDDAAVLAPSVHPQIVACDALVEGVHFKRSWIAPEMLGRRIVTSNASDFAAMGGTPRWALLSFTVPPSTDTGWCHAALEGVIGGLEEVGAVLVGGDTTSTGGPVTLSLTLGGDALWEPLRRSGGQIGDAIWVTGTLGDSALGLRMLKEGRGTNPDEAFVIARHTAPEARLDWGLWLAAQGVGRGAADVSDGFLQDLGHIARASGCSAEVQLEDIPLSEAYRTLHPGNGPGNLHDLALAGGEDFELVFTAAPDAKLPARRGEVPVTRVGRLVSGEPGAIRVLSADGSERRVPQAGWRHFRSDISEDV